MERLLLCLSGAIAPLLVIPEGNLRLDVSAVGFIVAPLYTIAMLEVTHR
jgi:hypothetical protein